MNNGFCGWYFRCQGGGHTLAMIPAVHTADGVRTGSVQLITETDSWSVPFAADECCVRSDAPCAVLGENLFSPHGVWLNLHTDRLWARGQLFFGPLSPLRYDIMGPFCAVPGMECRHSVCSMRHRVDGWLEINGKRLSFCGGVGYIEGDRGISFPSRYAWTQCWVPGGSVMLSVAQVPLCGLRFTGTVGIVQRNGREYRFATYLGARAQAKGGRLSVRQGEYCLSARLLDRSAHALQAPAHGRMDRVVRENVACRVRYRLSRKGRTLLDWESRRAAFEYEYGPGKLQQADAEVLLKNGKNL